MIYAFYQILTLSNERYIFASEFSQGSLIQFNFFLTIPSISTCRFTDLHLIWSMWNLHQYLEKDWSLVDCVFKVIDISMETIYQTNEKSIKRMNFVRTGLLYENWYQFLSMHEKGNMHEQNKIARLFSKKSRKQFKPCFLFNEVKWTERRTLFWCICFKRRQNTHGSYVSRQYKFCWFVISWSRERNFFSTTLP